MCRSLRISRQAYYKSKKARVKKALVLNHVKKQVLAQRNRCGLIGGRKLYHLMGQDLPIGRDTFFEYLRVHRLLVTRKRKYAKTTNSMHRFRVHKNLIKETRAISADQIWVSDITYLRTRSGFCYLSLITDAYSRKIVGYDLSDSLAMEGSIRALKMAKKQANNTIQTIHHSDRGFQYCRHKYQDLLRKYSMKTSMTNKGDCYENALAERVNGILKQDFCPDMTFENLEQAKKAVKQAINAYNNNRPHWGLNLNVPNKVYCVN